MGRRGVGLRAGSRGATLGMNLGEVRLGMRTQQRKGMAMGWRGGQVGRGAALAVLAAALVISAASGGLSRPAVAQGLKGAAGAPYTLRVITFSTPMVLAIAQGRGFLAAEGLQLDHTITQSSAQLMGGVIDGTYDIALTNPDNWITYVVRDNADVFMFQGNDAGGERVVMARPEIQSVDDLRGQALAVDAVDSGLVMILWKILNDQGLDFRPGDPRLVPVGATGPRLASMERGETAAGIVGLSDVEGAQARGLHALGSSRDHLPEYPGTQGGTTRRWAEAHPDVLIRFIRASAAASQWARTPANRAAAIALYRDATGANQETAEEAYDTLIPDAAIDVRGIQTILDLRVALGLMPAPAPPATRFYDTRYWEAATGQRQP
jgi:ABC-type nitrate/sulfonate/bicarbonate transport system substrate-binding protein